MRIAVNTRLLISDRLEGIGWFTYETLSRITRENKDVEFHFFFDRKFSQEFIFSKNVIPHVLWPQARHTTLFKYWFNVAVAKKLKKIDADLFLSPDGFLSLKTDVPQLAVIHDLNFEHYPEMLPKGVSKFYKENFPLFAKKAKRIATVSQFSKADINNMYDIPNDQIDVVYNGVSNQFRPLDDRDKYAVKNQFSEGKDYFVFVGSLHPRKNLHRLILAFDQFKKETGSPLKLVIVGSSMWRNHSADQLLEGSSFRGDVIFTGRLAHQQLASVIAGAKAMLFVPVFEGFGIPILEAFKCHVPVITSSTSSMPEVAGDAALYADPFSVASIAEEMIRLESNDDLGALLIEKGKERLKVFSWNKTAQLLWQSVLNTVGGK